MGLVLWALGPVLAPFVVAAVLAYALTPLVDRLDDMWGGRMPRWLAVTIVELLFIVAVFLLILLIVPVLIEEIPLIRAQLPLLLDKLHDTLSPWLAQFGVRISLDLASLRDLLVGYLNANWGDSFGSLWTSLKIGGSVGPRSRLCFANIYRSAVSLTPRRAPWSGRETPPQLGPRFSSFLRRVTRRSEAPRRRSEPGSHPLSHFSYNSSPIGAGRG